MGTRSLTFVSTSTGNKILNMYRQFDGYPSGHGKELFDFLDGMKIINGISNQRAGEAANGAGCLAAQMVAKFKTAIGGIYMYPIETTDAGQDYTYHVTVTEKRFDSVDQPGVNIKVISYGDKQLFDGSVEEFGKFCSKDGEDEAE